MRSFNRIFRLAAPAVAYAGVLVLTAGCNGDNSVDAGGGLSESDAAAIIVSSFGSGASTYGLTGQIEDGASVATGGPFGKADAFASSVRETTITKQKTSGAYTYEYTFHFTYGPANQSPFPFQYDMKGVYSTPRMSSNDSAHADLQFTILQQNSITLSGTYVRLGSQTFRAGETKQLTTVIQGTLTNITIDKITKRVTGGTVVLAITANRSDGSTITLTGTLTFLGNRQATLVINGKTFNLNFDYAEASAA
jgi:hypothetical protein